MNIVLNASYYSFSHCNSCVSCQIVEAQYLSSLEGPTSSIIERMKDVLCKLERSSLVNGSLSK